MAYVHSGEPGKALDLYNATLGANPSIVGTRAKSVAPIHNNLGMLLMQAGLTEAGVEHFKKAVAVFPRALNAHLNLGNVAFGGQRYTDAVAEYQTALSLSPDSPGIEQRLELARRRAESQ
jgi:tetratricopeptide (TPR) repeat protein